MQCQCLHRLKTSNVLYWLPRPWTLSSLLTPSSNCIISVISGLCNLPRDPQSAELTLGPPWSVISSAKVRRQQVFCFCWAAGKEREREKTSWKATYKGQWGVTTFTPCWILEKERSWFVFFVCEEGRCRWAPSWQFQGHQKATLSLAPYISHLGCLSGQRLSLKLYMKTNWFRKRSQECYSLTEFLFSADTITGSNSQPSLGCRASILPVAPQSYFFVQSCSLLSSAKWSGPFCLKWGKDITKTYGEGTLIKQGKC